MLQQVAPVHPLTAAEQARVNILRSPALHFATCVQILDKDRKSVRPTPNVLQIRMAQAYEVCQALGLPCKMLTLKPRQTGCSTFAAHLCYHHMRRYNAWGVEMADDLGNSKNLFRIFKRYADTDEFDWGFDFVAKTDEITFGNGSFMEQDTANNPKAGISATRQVIHFSEVAKYPTAGVRSDYTTISNMLASFNKTGPNSLAIAETTAEGAVGWFYDQWMGDDTQPGAVSLEQFLEGKTGNGWIRVFAAWHEFPEHSFEHILDRRPLTEAEKEAILASLKPREKRGQMLYGWTVEQIAWRRHIVATDCGGDERVFDMHYPEDPETCFLASGTPRFDQEGMAHLAQIAKMDTIRFGTLNASEHDPRSVGFTETNQEEGWIQLHEEPRGGYAYGLIVDPSTGGENQSGEDPDRHSVKVFRAPCREEDGREQPLRQVARVRAPCLLETDVLAKLIVRMHHFYGGCIVVVERNMGQFLIGLLKEAGVHLYVQERLDRVTSKTETYYGYNMDKEARKGCIDALAALVRDTTVERPRLVTDEHSVSEYRTFVRTDKGRYEARAGRHDDDVLCDAIAADTIKSFTTYREPIRRRRGPVDRHRWKRHRNW